MSKSETPFPAVRFRTFSTTVNRMDPNPAVPSADPIVELERVRASERRWKRYALMGIAAVGLLAGLSIVQFVATFVALKSVNDALAFRMSSRQSSRLGAMPAKPATTPPSSSEISTCTTRAWRNGSKSAKKATPWIS